MKRARAARPQSTPEELRDELLRFIQRHFYTDNIAFQKDRPRLLKWVVLKPAAWLEERGVTVSPERYINILRDRILMEALRHGTGEVKYVPAYLGRVVDLHLAHHGEEYYQAAKTLRDASDGALRLAKAGIGSAPDPVRQLASAARLLRAKKRPAKGPVKTQLTLL